MLQSKGTQEILAMIENQNEMIKISIAEGLEILRGKTILVAEKMFDDRPKIMIECQES
jgi:hypothetical protein